MRKEGYKTEQVINKLREDDVQLMKKMGELLLLDRLIFIGHFPAHKSQAHQCLI